MEETINAAQTNNNSNKRENLVNNAPTRICKKTAKAFRPSLLAIAIAQAAAMPSVQAATIVVNNSGDAGIGCTLRKAVDMMNAQSLILGCSESGVFGQNDEINFDGLGGGVSGNSVNLTQGALEIDRNLNIFGGAPFIVTGFPTRVGRTTIQSNGNGRIFTLDESGTEIALNNLSLRGGHSDTDGGGILVSNAALTMNHSTISGNSADQDGGGLFIASPLGFNNAQVVLNNSTLSGNSAGRSGGGAALVRLNISESISTLNFNNSTISGNYAKSNGGGISLESQAYTLGKSLLTLDNSTLSGNVSGSEGVNVTYVGGAGIFSLDGSVDIRNSTISENHITDPSDEFFNAYGGGILAINSRLSLVASTVSSNSAISGGGIYLLTSSASIHNSTISNNIGTVGFGVFATDSDLALINVSLTENIGSSHFTDVPALYFNSGTLTLFNSILANTRGGFDCSILVSDGSTVFADDSNIIENNANCGTSALSIDPKLGPLADNGGPTKTHALYEGSPAIDAGNDAKCAELGVDNFDQRGEPRPVDAHCDIGAYEGSIKEPSSFFVIPAKNGKTVIFSL